jgi:hypothetical protein
MVRRAAGLVQTLRPLCRAAPPAGVVYKARHVPSGRIVALKKVRFERSR